MLSTKSYYSNPNLLKKIRIKSIAATIEEYQNQDFQKVVKNSFTASRESVSKNENKSNSNFSTGW